MPATQREDSNGIDCYVKMPKDARILPVQVTQRGVRYYRYINKPSPEKLQDFVALSEKRIALKRQQCYLNGIVFVLLRDSFGTDSSLTLTYSDVRSLYHGVRNLKRYP